MIEFKQLEEFLKKEIEKLRNLGEHERAGSDHLYFRSLNQFKLGKIKELKAQDPAAFEVICTYNIYTETEFLHSPDMDELYTEHYKDKFIFDKDFTLLEVKDMRKEN